jgi:hypothetical protein
MKVLIACEFSQVVCSEFRQLGHEAYSCDILPGEIDPRWHLQTDVFNILNDGWDLMIAHPPCTRLACSGAKWFKIKQREQAEAVDFFLRLANAPIEKICIENPIGIMSTRFRKPDQIVQPWMFGDRFHKSTCLWLKNLPLLTPTNIVDRGEFVTLKSGKVLPKWYSNTKGHKKGDNSERAKNRSRTFPGFARAMAVQFSINLA